MSYPNPFSRPDHPDHLVSLLATGSSHGNPGTVSGRRPALDDSPHWRNHNMSFRALAVTALVLASTLIPGAASAQQYHLLILTPNEFVDELLPLKYWKEETGRHTLIVPLGEVYEIHFGEVRDNPEQIKRYIADFVTTYGVDHVMLVGDCDKFPVRYVKGYNTEWGDKYYPSDLYYMDLWDANGDLDLWDGNGNNIIGEMDFAGGTDVNLVNLDNIDMVPDVSLARVPASSGAEVTTYVDKVIGYESSTHDAAWFRTSALAVDGGSGAFGSTTKMNALVPYLHHTTTGKLYEDNAPYKTMTFAQRAQALNTAINNGAGFVSWYGHGNRTLWAGWYDSNQISGLTNDTTKRYPIVFATSCYTARFHFDRSYYYDVDGNLWTAGTGQQPEPMDVQPSAADVYGNESMAEHMLVKSAKGAVGYIGCVSKAEHGAWLGNNVGLNPYFYAQYAAGVRTLGEMWTGALTTYVTDLKNPTTGGMFYYSFLHLHKMILFGDPSLMIPDLPDPTIEASGSHDPVTTTSYSTLNVKVSLDPASADGAQADWWLLHAAPGGWSFFVPGVNLWVPGIWVTFQGGLADLPSSQVFSGTLAPGNHTFYFGVDTLMNGAIDFDRLSWDAVTVTVN